jgi:hypothetical protein
MINIGLIDLLLLAILVIALVYSLRGHNLLPFAAILVIVLLIELERLAPGAMVALGNAIHEIDVINEQLPHIQISPIVTIQS